MTARLDDLTDEELVGAYVDATRPRGEREQAFHHLVTRYQRRVFAICIRQLGSRSDAEDVTQDTFLHLARKADQFRGDAAWSTFVYRVAVNACRDLQRKQGRRPQTPVEDVTRAQVAAGVEPDVGPDEFGARERAMVVREALAQLDDVSRMLLVLCAIEGLTYPEAAEVVGMPVGTIKSRVFRARARLAELLADEPDDQQRRAPGTRSEPASPPTWPQASPRGPPT